MSYDIGPLAIVETHSFTNRRHLWTTMKLTSCAVCVALLLTAGTGAALAQQPPMSPGNGPHFEMPPLEGPPRGPAFAVINDLEHLQRLYDLSGRPDDIMSVYRDVLRDTQDPMVRHFVHDALARAQLRPRNPEQAIATIRTSLSEDLATLAKHPAPMLPDGPPPPAN